MIIWIITYYGSPIRIKLNTQKYCLFLQLIKGILLTTASGELHNVLSEAQEVSNLNIQHLHFIHFGCSAIIYDQI